MFGRVFVQLFRKLSIWPEGQKNSPHLNKQSCWHSSKTVKPLNACYGLSPPRAYHRSVIGWTIGNVSRWGDYLFYSQTVLIDLIRGSWPFLPSGNALYDRVSPLPSLYVIDWSEMSCVPMAGVTLMAHEASTWPCFHCCTAEMLLFLFVNRRD